MKLSIFKPKPDLNLACGLDLKVPSMNYVHLEEIFRTPLLAFRQDT